MDSVTVCAVAILCVFASVCIRVVRPEFSTVLRLCFCILFGFWMLSALSPLVADLRTWMDQTVDGGEILFRALGIATLTHLTAEICRDGGENTLATGVETLGKLEILALSLPLIRNVMNTVTEILRW